VVAKAKEVLPRLLKAEARRGKTGGASKNRTYDLVIISDAL